MHYSAKVNVIPSLKSYFSTLRKMGLLLDIVIRSLIF